MRKPLLPPGLPIVLTVALLTVGGTAVLSNYFVDRSLGGGIMYLLAGLIWNLLGFYTMAMLVFRRIANTSNARPLAQIAVAAGAIVGVFALSLASLVLVPLVTGAIVGDVYYSDPIGVGDDVARGPCTTRSVDSARSPNGLIAEVRETVCSGNWDGDFMYFVFVRPPSDRDTKQSLAFRYFADADDLENPPTAIWKSKDRLAIGTRSNTIAVTYQLHAIRNVSIEYALGSAHR